MTIGLVCASIEVVPAVDLTEIETQPAVEGTPSVDPSVSGNVDLEKC